MIDGLLPLFPLEVVLFPHTPLALHIFEERYKEMIGECLALQLEFGVVLVRGNGVARTGCAASVLEVVRRHDDGKLDILTLGRRRFHLLSIHSRRSFLEGAVEFFDDADPLSVNPTALRTATAAHRQLLLLTGATAEPPPPDHPAPSFLLAQISTNLDFRQSLLELRSEAERLDRVAGHLALLVQRHTVGDAMKSVARSNGRGHHLPGLALPE